MGLCKGGWGRDWWSCGKGQCSGVRDVGMEGGCREGRWCKKHGGMWIGYGRGVGIKMRRDVHQVNILVMYRREANKNFHRKC